MLPTTTKIPGCLTPDAHSLICLVSFANHKKLGLGLVLVDMNESVSLEKLFSGYHGLIALPPNVQDLGLPVQLLPYTVLCTSQDIAETGWEGK